MPKLFFHVSGHKKQPRAAPKQVTAPDLDVPTSKAHKILGSTALSIHEPGRRDAVVPGPNGPVRVSGRNPHTYAAKTRDRPRLPGRDDDSHVLSPHLQLELVADRSDDGATELTSTLRGRQSSSTIKSWYDRSKQPLDISQQTSASAMAKGPPTKAQRMLDMNYNSSSNGIANPAPKPKPRKKPAKLDLASFVSARGSRGDDRRPGGKAHDFILSPDSSSKSDPFTPPSPSAKSASPGQRRRLRKRPTMENLSSPPHAGPARPSTSGGSGRRAFDGQDYDVLPELYQHYEQMSLRQLMDLDVRQDKDDVDPCLRAIRDATSHQGHSSQHPSRPRLQHHYQQPRQRPGPGGDPPRGHDSHDLQTSYVLPLDVSSPPDCAASVSSRHTRTSKATGHTDDKSFQGSDFQDRSVLMLSSDSDDDLTDEPVPRKGPPAGGQSRPQLRAEGSPGQWDLCDGEAKGASAGVESLSSKSSQTASLTPGPVTQPSKGILPRSESRRTTQSWSDFHAYASPSRASAQSISSAGTSLTGQGKAGYGIQEARAVAMLPARGPAMGGPEQEGQPASDLEMEVPRQAAHRDSGAGLIEPPTSPLSPSSVDFYVQPIQRHDDLPGSSPSRFIAVSRQEEMLLSALRNKRQLMRASAKEESRSDAAAAMMDSLQHSRGSHQSQPSDATITGLTSITTKEPSVFDFDFPAPPSGTSSGRGSGSESASVLPRASANQSCESFTMDESDTGTGLTPAPRRHLQGRPSARSHKPVDQTDPIFVYMDRSSAPGMAEASPDADDADDYAPVGTKAYVRTRSSSQHSALSAMGGGERLCLSDLLDSGFDDSDGVGGSGGRTPLRSQSSSQSERLRREFLRPAPISEVDEDDIPRPDSPISPDYTPAMPKEVASLARKMARLSAVGPAPLAEGGRETGWWGDDD